MAMPKRSIKIPWTLVGRWILGIAMVCLFVFLATQIPKMPRTMAILRPIFFLLPDTVAFVLALVGVALIFMAEELKRLDGKPIIRWVIAIIIFLFGLGAVISNSAQKAQDKQDAQKDRDKLLDALIGVQRTDDQILNLIQQASRSTSSTLKTADLIKAWGRISTLTTPAVRGAVATASIPPNRQNKRNLNAEDLGAALRGSEHGAATIINDGTVEAGTFAKQLEIGLKMASWPTGGDNVKIGDPNFFPDSLTIEVSSLPASPEDHSTQEAKSLIAALQKQRVDAVLRFTDLRFPPNFLRIKVAGR
jgi:hypothetical protein